MVLRELSFSKESLGKMKEFCLDSLKVNKLFEKYLKTSKKTDEEDFMIAWTETSQKKESYFYQNGGEINWPNKKMVVTENDAYHLVELKESHRASSDLKKIEKVVVFYDLNDNQNGEISKNGFPYLGVFLAIIFCDHLKQNLFKMAIAGTSPGCDLIKPIINPEELTISVNGKSLKFFSVDELDSIIDLCKDVVNQINNSIKGEQVAFYLNI